MNEKTEQPTPKKLRDARKKGQVAKSKEVPSAALIITVMVLLMSLMGSFFHNLRDMMLAPTKFYDHEFESAASSVLDEILRLAAGIVIPIVAAVAVVGIIANVAQVGLMFSTESLKPKLSNLSPASGIKKIFAFKNLMEFIKSVLKIAFLSLLLYLVIRGALPDLVKLPHCGVGCLPEVLRRLFTQIFAFTAAAFVIIAFADYVFEKYQFTKQQMMSKDEIKREYKESEGDPHVKGKRKQFAQELVQGQRDEGVKKSDVVVTNPTHLAVALAYKAGETPLPIVRAMGENMQAHRMVKIARDNGIPVMENVPVARGLFETAEVDRYIPSEMIEAVAEVMRLVRDLGEPS